MMLKLLLLYVCVLSIGWFVQINAEPYRYPSIKPTVAPTSVSPTVKPTAKPTITPTPRPTPPPQDTPTINPAYTPTVIPTEYPTRSFFPSPVPTSRPSMAPSSQPSASPSRQPSSQPSRQPTCQPTSTPTQPTSVPSAHPTRTYRPTPKPSITPTYKPSTSSNPSRSPSISPTAKPTTIKPTATPTVVPTIKPTSPTVVPTFITTGDPTFFPTKKPTESPSFMPSVPTSQPSSSPSNRPSRQPSSTPTRQPYSSPSMVPSSDPTSVPSVTHRPSSQPSTQPTGFPTDMPSNRPTGSPTQTHKPSELPSGQPSSIPTRRPTDQPTGFPSTQPSSQPSCPSSYPTTQPSRSPTTQPSAVPSMQPTGQPSLQPSSQPTLDPTGPTSIPSTCPSRVPSSQPSSEPTHTPKPTVLPYPTSTPTNQPTNTPSCQPSGVPSQQPTATYEPSSKPSRRPRSRPTSRPTWYSGDFTETPTAIFENMGVSGYVEVDPDNSNMCTPLEVRITVQFNRNLSAGSVFYITTPGMTSGPCYTAVDGENINNVLVPNTAKFSASYKEGTYVNNYADSRLRFELQEDVNDGPMYIVLDRTNAFRHTCSANASWIVSVTPSGKNGGESGFIDYLSIHHKKCVIFDSILNFSNPMPQFETGINVTLHFGYTLEQNTRITITLPSFTNVQGAFTLNNRLTNGTDFVGNGVSTRLHNLTWSTNFSWSGSWHEGTHESGYAGSNLTLRSYGDQLYNTPFWVYIPKLNNLKATQGSSVNDTKYKISSNDSIAYYFTEQTPVAQSNGIGPGCSQYSDCFNHGRCNYNKSICECDEGYGSALDRSRTINKNFNPDCSSKACPHAPGIAALFQFNNVTNSTRDMHREMECSNNGICNRLTGMCKCNVGFMGAACQKMVCPNKCNQRGTCTSMKRLALSPEGIPMSRKRYDYDDNGNGTLNVSWDAELGHVCVCDSSWPVGLGAGETQQAEYFGVSCENRRCPSGDDPDTPHVDERNCSNKATLNKLTNKWTVGAAGNLCHVDCSNRGLCDYSSGLCKCFDGYGGANCDTRLSQLKTKHNVTNTFRALEVSTKQNY